jgi:dihydrofolate reductase
MRKIINSTYISLDGVIQNPQDWPSLGASGEDGNAIQTELLLACDAVLMGRHTYDGFAAVCGRPARATPTATGSTAWPST